MRSIKLIYSLTSLYLVVKRPLFDGFFVEKLWGFLYPNWDSAQTYNWGEHRGLRLLRQNRILLMSEHISQKITWLAISHKISLTTQPSPMSAIRSKHRVRITYHCWLNFHCYGPLVFRDSIPEVPEI